MNFKVRLLFLTAVLLFCGTLAGCSSGIDERLVGKWQVSKPNSINRKVGGDSDAVDKQEQLPSMSVEFSRSGKLTTVTKMGKIDSVKTGSWHVLDAAKDSKTIQIQCQLSMQTTEHDIELDGASIRWIPPNLAGTKQKILFERSKN